jgi:hypothetical protein
MDQARINGILKAQSTLPEFLRRDRAAIEADEIIQDLRRASFGRGHLNLAERQIARGVTLESIALSNLPLVRNEDDLQREQIRLTEGLELQGRFDEAAQVHPSEGESLRMIADAVRRDDSEVCDCPVTQTDVAGKSIEIHPSYEVKKVYSRKHGQMVSLVGCTACGFLNATPDPPDQLQAILRAHEASAVAGRPMAHEYEVLRSSN